MYSFSRTAGCYEGRPVASGATPSNPTLDKSSLATKASITRTGLSSSTQSSRHSGNSVAWPRSIPSTKRLIRSLRQKAAESYSANQITKRVFTQPGSIATEEVEAAPSRMSASPRKRTNIQTSRYVRFVPQAEVRPRSERASQKFESLCRQSGGAEGLAQGGV